jgi:FkbM family methyltransferase
MKPSGFSKALIAAIAFVAALAVFIYGFPQYGVPLSSFVTALGRTAPCGPWEALRGLSVHFHYARGDAPIAASARLLKDDPAGYHLWSTSRGQYWLPADSDPVLPLLLSQQQYRIYGDLRAGDVVLDCGAHVGVYTREALNAGARLVVSIEPAPDNLECLRRNFAPEIREGRVIVCPVGVWNKQDHLVLHTVAGNSAGDSFVFKDEPGQGIVIPLTTIDILATELKLPRVTMIKMDIKGSECPALMGAARVLRTDKPRLAIVSEHLPDDPERIPAIVHGFRPDYKVRCGVCFQKNGRIRPEVLLFD